MKQIVRNISRLESTIYLPGDKSVSHRAVLLNSMASGNSHVSNYAPGEDGTSMLRCLRSLGIPIRKHYNCTINGSDECLTVDEPYAGNLREPSKVLNAGNSATTMRLMSGLLATQPFVSVITGDNSLVGRDMSRVIKPLAKMGATIIGRDHDSFAPITIQGGNLRGIKYTLPIASAQVKSAILIAGVCAKGRTTIIEPVRSRDHTEQMLKAMGASIEIDNQEISIEPSKLRAIDIKVPGDISSAAFWLVAGCCHPNAQVRIQNVGINPTRAGILDVLKKMGGNIKIENRRQEGGELIADITAESSNLVATKIKGPLVPRVIDELPVLALAACFAKGTTVIEDSAELRNKESDRIETTTDGLLALGARIDKRADGMVIEGGVKLTGNLTRSHGDHRIAMTMAIAGILASGETVIDGAESASVTYPNFWDTINNLGIGDNRKS